MTASYRLAAYKSAALVVLIIFHLVALALRVQSSVLHTRMAIATEVLSVSSNIGALALSFLVDQRSVKPSDVLVLYYSASTILGIPRLRTLWLFPPDYVIQQAIWTILLILTASVATIECFGKTKYLRPAVKNGLTSEQMTSFWSRSFFVWLLPVFQKGYSNLFIVDDLPDIDKDMKESATWAELEAAWRRTQGGRIGFRLVRATFRANSRSFLSAIVPRLMLSAFTFCQPFLIQAAVSHLSGTANEDDHERFGQALVGAFALVYLGIAVSQLPVPTVLVFLSQKAVIDMTTNGFMFPDIKGSILASNLSYARQGTSRSDSKDISPNSVTSISRCGRFSRTYFNGH